MNNRRQFWLSCNRFTVYVECDEEGIILRAAPLVYKFIGQHFDCLVEWAGGFGGVVVMRL